MEGCHKFHKSFEGGGGNEAKEALVGGEKGGGEPHGVGRRRDKMTGILEGNDVVPSLHGMKGQKPRNG